MKSVIVKKASLSVFGVILLVSQTACGGSSPSPAGVTIEQISTDGGRVAWYKGGSHELIAYDAIVDDANKNTEVFVMNPDGTGIQCVTCSSNIPKGFIGQPEWHPDGQHLIVQAENINSQHIRYNHLSWGINQDLWIVKLDGTGAEKIYDNSSFPQHSALHPHFNDNGTMLIFAERIATGEQLFLPSVTPGGENPWAGWQIHLASFDLQLTGTGKLFNHLILYGSGLAKDRGFYETHGFINNSEIIYSATAGGENYVDDVYTANIDGTAAINLTNSASTWEEHGSYSPSGNALVFISSRVNTAWQAPMDDASTLRTELYIERAGLIEQLTSFNANGDADKRYLTSDFEWDAEGKRITVLVQPVDDLTGVSYPAEIWLITLPEPQ